MADPLPVLLVEDNPRDAELLEESLADVDGARVRLERVETLDAALGRVARGGVAVVLLDLNLPDSGGLATLRTFHARAPSVPVLVLTGVDDEALGVAAVEHGAQDYLVKGRFDGPGLVRAMRYAVARADAEAARVRVLVQEKEIERLEELNRFRAEFMNMAAHELSTPLTPIKLQLYMLQNAQSKGLSPDQVEAVALLRRNVDRLARLVADILTSTNLQAGRFGLDLQPIRLDGVLHEAVASFREPARRAGVTLELALDGELAVAGDPARLTQVLFNLLDNALKFTPRGGRVMVEARDTAETVLVRVRDDGAGLTREDLARLFHPFTQAHPWAQTSRHGGSGLGLYICRGIVDLHGGRIWAESDGLGAGAVFTFALPRRAPASLPGPAQAAEAPATPDEAHAV